MSEQITTARTEDRTMPGAVYGLYLLGAVSGGLTVLIGLFIAYAVRGGAGPRGASHLTFMIRTFWLSIGWFLIGAALIFWGGIFSLILVGLPFFALGWLIVGAIGVWFYARAILGVIYLARDEAYPRPRTWLI